MNAGKSTSLLQYRHNLQSRNLSVWCGSTVKPLIYSRINISCEAIHIHKTDDLRLLINNEKHILIDEAQFLTKEQVYSLCALADDKDIRVYGLRTDFLGNIFEGSSYLLGLSDRIIEIETTCFCSEKATMTMRLDQNNIPVIEGEQLLIEGKYISLCRKHYFELIKSKQIVPLHIN